MDVELFGKRLVERLRKRSADYEAMLKRTKLPPDTTPAEISATISALSETADCIEEVLASVDE